MKAKVCHTCQRRKAFVYVCRDCTRRVCEHFCKSKQGDKATCGSCSLKAKPLTQETDTMHTLKNFRATFNGRKIGAIGVMQSHTVTVKGFDKENAGLKLYETHEHITALNMIELVERFAVTHLDSDGFRQYTRANQGRNHFDTFEQAQKWLDAAREELRTHLLGDKADTLEVRPILCYQHGDGIHCAFSCDENDEIVDKLIEGTTL